MKRAITVALAVTLILAGAGLAYGFGGYFDDPTVTQNQHAIGNYFNDIYWFLDPAGTISYRINEVYDSGTAQYLQALNNLSPEGYAAVTGVNLGSFGQFNSLTIGHLAALRSPYSVTRSSRPLVFADSGTIMLDAAPLLYTPATGGGNGWSVWGEDFGLFGRQGDRGGEFGYKYDTFGFSLGVDKAVSDTFAVGLVTGYSHSWVDFNDVSFTGNVSSFDLGFYGSYNPGPWYVDASFTWARNWHETERYDLFANATADGKYFGDVFAAYLGGGYTIGIGKAAITPEASLTYTYYNQPGFSETGAGLFNLSVNRFDSHSLISRLGLRFAYEFDLANVKVVPEVSAFWAHEYMDTNRTVVSRLLAEAGDETFAVNGVKSDRDGAILGLGLTARFNNGFSLYGDYNAELRQHYSSNGFTLGIRYEF